MARRNMEEMVVWAAVVLGGGYLLYRLLNQTPAASTVPGAVTAPASPTIQAGLNTALTNLATGITDLTA